MLQNCSEKLKNAFSSTIYSILLRFSSSFQASHTIFTIKLQTLGLRNSELHFARQKQCFGEQPCPRLQPQPFPSRSRYKTAARMPQIKKHRETLGRFSARLQAGNRVYYHSEVRTPYRYAMFGEYPPPLPNYRTRKAKSPKADG